MHDRLPLLLMEQTLHEDLRSAITTRTSSISPNRKPVLYRLTDYIVVASDHVDTMWEVLALLGIVGGAIDSNILDMLSHYGSRLGLNQWSRNVQIETEQDVEAIISVVQSAIEQTVLRVENQLYRIETNDEMSRLVLNMARSIHGAVRAGLSRLDTKVTEIEQSFQRVDDRFRQQLKQLGVLVKRALGPVRESTNLVEAKVIKIMYNRVEQIVWKNPTATEFVQLGQKYKELRMLLDVAKDDVYVWDAYMMWHQAAIRELNLPQDDEKTIKLIVKDGVLDIVLSFADPYRINQLVYFSPRMHRMLLRTGMMDKVVFDQSDVIAQDGPIFLLVSDKTRIDAGKEVAGEFVLWPSTTIARLAVKKTPTGLQGNHLNLTNIIKDKPERIETLHRMVQFNLTERKMAPKGTFVEALFDEETVEKLSEWMTKMNIHEPMPVDELHVTVVLDKSRDLDIEPKDLQIEIDPSTFELEWFGDDNNVLVLTFLSNRLQSLHKSYRDKYDIDWDFPEYIPHVTLSCTKQDMPDQVPTFPLRLNRTNVDVFEKPKIYETVINTINGWVTERGELIPGDWHADIIKKLFKQGKLPDPVYAKLALWTERPVSSVRSSSPDLIHEHLLYKAIMEQGWVRIVSYHDTIGVDFDLSSTSMRAIQVALKLIHAERNTIRFYTFLNKNFDNFSEFRRNVLEFVRE